MPADADDLDWYIDNVVVPGDIERHPVGPVRQRQGHWRAIAHALRAQAPDCPIACAERLAATQGFVLSGAQAASCGVDDATKRRMVRHGRWTRAGAGMLAVVSDGCGAEDGREAARCRHTLRAAAAAHKRPGHAIATASAAVTHGLPVLALPRLPELCTGTGRTFGRLETARVRFAQLDPVDLESWYGIPITTVARTVVEMSRFDPEGGLVATDAALHESVLSVRELNAALERCSGLSGIRRARAVLRLASASIESPLESLVHLRLAGSGFPPPELQFPVIGANGKRYRADFAWPEHRLLLEADGRLKYTGDELWAEKNREFALQRAGWRIVRVRWHDVGAGWPETAKVLTALFADRSW